MVLRGGVPFAAISHLPLRCFLPATTRVDASAVVAPPMYPRAYFSRHGRWRSPYHVGAIEIVTVPEHHLNRDRRRPPRLRVAFLIWRLSASGGIPRFQASLLSSVADRSWLDLHVISVRPNYAEDNLAQYESLATFHFLDLDGPSTIPKRLKALARLAAVLRKLRPDILHVHGGIGWLPSILPGPKTCVLQVHDPPQTGRDSVLTSWVERWASRLRKWHLVVDSSGVADQLAEAWNLDRASVRVESLGIDTNHYSPAQRGFERARQYSRHGARIRVAWLGRLVPSKQPAQFVELASSIHEDLTQVTCCLGGDGPLMGELEDLNDEAGGACQLIGSVPDVWDFLANSDIFVSTSEAEGFGLAVLEAMSMGLPVVAFEAAGLHDLIVDGTTGYLLPMDDLAAMAARLRYLTSNPEALQEMGSAAARRANSLFSLASMGERYVQLWSDIAPPEFLHNHNPDEWSP